jgi:flagellar biosynthesis protein
MQIPKNKTIQSAVALAYRNGQSAPKVVAKGNGVIAEEIIKRANESGIYVHQSTELVALLMQVNLDDRIPPQLYIAVAELLAWLYRLELKEEMLTANSNSLSDLNSPQ